MSPPPVQLEIAPRALTDIEDAAAFIARDNPAAAESFLEATGQTFEQLTRSPELGPRALALDEGTVRALSIPRFRRYRIFYVYDRQRPRLRVLRVLHGARDWTGLLDH